MSDFRKTAKTGRWLGRTVATAAALAIGLTAQPAGALPELDLPPGVDIEDVVGPPAPALEPAQPDLSQYITGPMLNYWAEDYPDQNHDLPPVCRWEIRNGRWHQMMYVKIEDGRTATANLEMVAYVYLPDGTSEARPIVMRPGVEDFVLDITGHADDVEWGAIGAYDREGYDSLFVILDDCGLFGPEWFNRYYG